MKIENENVPCKVLFNEHLIFNEDENSDEVIVKCVFTE